MSVPPTHCVFWVQPHLNHFFQFAVQPPDWREHVPTAPTPNTLTALLFPVDSCEIPVLGVSHVALSLPELMPKQTRRSQTGWRAEPGAEPRRPGWPLWCSEFKTLFLLQVCQALSNTSGLRRKDGSWKGKYFLCSFQCLWPRLWKSIWWAAKERNAWVNLKRTSGLKFSVVLILA